ncbi:hypothetical protein SCAR479_03480 [Seiridium cardinale]|uniref:Uncharacterized protein n=1 Tax=Seiridium cardinale TaxID=138064 RepID=A0ABR2Y1D6_9PEZI
MFYILFILNIILCATIGQAAPVPYIYNGLKPTSHDYVVTAGSAVVDLIRAGLLTRDEASSNGTETTPQIDGSAGTYLDPAAWGAIIGGAVACLLLVFCLFWCGKRQRW